MFRNRQWHNAFLYMVSHESFSDFDLKVIFQFLSKMANNRFVSVVSVLCQRSVPWWCIALDAHSESLAGSVLIDRCVLAICTRQIKCYWNENVHMKCILCMSIIFVYHNIRYNRGSIGIVYPKKYAHGFCFAVLCCGYTLTDFPICIRLTSLALWQSNDCPSASKATLMNMDKYLMLIHYERLHNHKKVKHNKTVCIFLVIYCIYIYICLAKYWR